MKLRTILKIATVTSVMLLCLGFAILLYFRMSINERAEDFDLYTLVPIESQMVVDTDNMVGLMQHINELHCSKDNHFLYFSDFFSYLKEHINGFLEHTPHGLSKQMNKMLISFHKPESARNQVFYCRLGAGDTDFIEQFIYKYFASSFPVRFFDYRGESIRIYPMPGDTFLACYVDTEFLVVSYQKKLIERVIDTRLSKKSILSDSIFSTIRSGHRMIAPVTIYTRMQAVEMGYNNADFSYLSDLGNWTEFNINLNGESIYLSGTNYDTDSCYSFVNTLRAQQPITEFPDSILPPSTFYFTKLSISNMEEVLDFTSRHSYAKVVYFDVLEEGNRVVSDFLKDYVGDNVTTCMFRNEDTLSNVPHTIMSFPLKNHSGAKQLLNRLYYTVPRQDRLRLSPEMNSFTASTRYVCSVLPRNDLLARLSGNLDFSLFTYACIYKDQLLLSPNTAGLHAYIKELESERALLDEVLDYGNIVSTLSQSYSFMMMGDMESLLEQPENYTRFIPNFFFRYRYFFRYFVFTSQFTCIDGVVYPNLILTYKGEDVRERIADVE